MSQLGKFQIAVSGSGIDMAPFLVDTETGLVYRATRQGESLGWTEWIQPVPPRGGKAKTSDHRI